MELQVFVEKGGFKMLSVARLGATSYALVCYLMNCLVAGVAEVVSSTGELSVLLGVPDRQVRSALDELESCKIVALTKSSDSKTLVLRFQLDVETWQNLRTPQPHKHRSHLGDARNVRTLHPQKQTEPWIQDASDLTQKSIGLVDLGLSSEQALLFPLDRRLKQHKSPNNLNKPGLEAIEMSRVLDAFKKTKGDEGILAKESDYAQMLCESHPTDQIISLVEMFGVEIPSLSLLAGAWVHYSERFNQMGQEELSLEAYRKKSQVMERKLRQLAQSELKRSASFKLILTPEEELLLRIFTRHPHPRRQLFWALQVAERYPHLDAFFSVTKEMALKPNAIKKET